MEKIQGVSREVRFTEELKDRPAQNQREIMPPIEDGFRHCGEGLVRICSSACHVRRSSLSFCRFIICPCGSLRNCQF